MPVTTISFRIVETWKRNKLINLFRSMYINRQDLDKYFKDSVENHSEEVPDDVWERMEVNLNNKKGAYNEDIKTKVESVGKLKTNNKKDAICVKFRPALTNKLKETDEIFKKAAEQYPLNTQNFDWELIQKKLKVQNKYSLSSHIRRLLIKMYHGKSNRKFRKKMIPM